MAECLQIDKDISWDNQQLELRLYLQEGYTAEQIVVLPERVNVSLRNGELEYKTHFALPVSVDNTRAVLTKRRGTFGETIDISARRCFSRKLDSQELAG